MKILKIKIDCNYEFCGTCELLNYYQGDAFLCLAFHEILGLKDGLPHRHWKCMANAENVEE